MIFDDKLLLYLIIFLKNIYVKRGVPSIKKLAPCALRLQEAFALWYALHLAQLCLCMWRVIQTTKFTMDFQINKWGSNIQIA